MAISLLVVLRGFAIGSVILVASFLRSRLWHNRNTLRKMLEFYHSFDASTLAERLRQRAEDHGVPLVDPKEEPIDETPLT